MNTKRCPICWPFECNPLCHHKADYRLMNFLAGVIVIALAIAFGCAMILAFMPHAKAAPNVIGPTMLAITNCLQKSSSPNGPWTNVNESYTIVYKLTPPTEFYRAVLKSSTPIP